MIPSPEFFVHLFDYVKWADLRQLETAKALSDEEYYKDRGWSFGTIHRVLLHQLAAQNIWLNRFLGEAPIWLYDDPAMKTRERIEPAWRGIHDRFSNFIASQTPQSLADVVRYANLRGDQFAFPLWQLLLHVCNHSTHHRGQLNSMIKLAGGKPVATDYSTYFAQAPRS